ncbi:hypothetical protein E2320_007037, partial [Naja naja]
QHAQRHGGKLSNRNGSTRAQPEVARGNGREQNRKGRVGHPSRVRLGKAAVGWSEQLHSCLFPGKGESGLCVRTRFVPAGLMERSGAMTDMYDQALLGILQHVGNVQEFLNILFGFLYRKTDFYRLLMQPSDRLGFPPGVAKSMAVRAFKTFEQLAHQDDEKRQQEIEVKLKKKEADMVAAGERPKVPPAIVEVEIATAVEQDSGLESGKTADAEEPVKAEETIEAQIVDATAELPVSVTAPVESQQTEFPRILGHY